MIPNNKYNKILLAVACFDLSKIQKFFPYNWKNEIIRRVNESIPSYRQVQRGKH